MKETKYIITTLCFYQEFKVGWTLEIRNVIPHMNSSNGDNLTHLSQFI